jgi:hypothetical protein
MKQAKIFIIGLALFALLAPISQATVEEKAQDKPHTALFTVPELNETVTKNFVKSLAKLEGIISAKSTEKGAFAVTFDPAKTDAKKIEAVLAEISPDSKLDKVALADDPHAGSDCNKCPLKKKCSKKDKE